MKVIGMDGRISYYVYICKWMDIERCDAKNVVDVWDGWMDECCF